MKYSPDGSHIVSGSEDKTVRVWDAHSLRSPIVLPLGVGCVCVSSGKSRIFTGTLAGELLSWSLNSGDETADATPKSILAHDDSIFSVQYVSKIDSIITASRDRYIKVWSLSTVDQSITAVKAEQEFLAHKVCAFKGF
jgi:WD40 repeat protein